MNCKDKCSWAVLWPAAASGQEVVKLLLKKGANTDSRDQWDQRRRHLPDGRREAVVRLRAFNCKPLPWL